MDDLERHQVERVSHLDLIGGELCLDFTNTAGDHKEEHPDEHLTSYQGLVAWSRHVDILTPQAAQALLARAKAHPTDADQVLHHALELREALYRIFSAVSVGGIPKPTDQAILNRYLHDAFKYGRLVALGRAFVWEWESSNDALDQMLWQIARSAEQLLTSDRLARVRECDGDSCGWLFVDTSKNHSRRWCSMNDCGNRAKARRFYRRARRAENA